MFRLSRKIVAGSATLALVGGLLGFVFFGTSFGSYMRSSVGMVKSTVKDNIPIEFEIQRARVLLEDLIPEMHANIRLAAAEEVEVKELEREIAFGRQSIEEERDKLHRLRDTLRAQQVSYKIGTHCFERGELVEKVATRFDRLKMTEKFLEGKQGLLLNRKRSLGAALKNLDKTRFARVELESQIEALEEQFRLMKLQNSGNQFQLDNTSLAKVERVITDLKKRLDIAERVMAQEARFVDEVPFDIVDEAQVLDRVDSYFEEQDEPGGETAPSRVSVEAF